MPPATRPLAALFAAPLLGCLALLPACEQEPAPAEGTTPQASATAAEGDVAVEWLDDEAAAAGVSYHRIAGRFTAGKDHAADMRRIARDALVQRARTLGFLRLDNLQIETGCADDAPADSACFAKAIAIASR